MTSGGLLYTTNASGSWVTEIVEADSSGEEGGRYTSIALDSSQKIHIAYKAKYDLKYATNASGSWVTETIEWAGDHPSIAVDSSNVVHISFSQGSYYTEISCMQRTRRAYG